MYSKQVINSLGWYQPLVLLRVVYILSVSFWICRILEMAAHQHIFKRCEFINPWWSYLQLHVLPEVPTSCWGSLWALNVHVIVTSRQLLDDITGHLYWFYRWLIWYWCIGLWTFEFLQQPLCSFGSCGPAFSVWQCTVGTELQLCVKMPHVKRVSSVCASSVMHPLRTVNYLICDWSHLPIVIGVTGATFAHGALKWMPLFPVFLSEHV